MITDCRCGLGVFFFFTDRKSLILTDYLSSENKLFHCNFFLNNAPEFIEEKKKCDDNICGNTEKPSHRDASPLV